MSLFLGYSESCRQNAEVQKFQSSWLFIYITTSHRMDKENSELQKDGIKQAGFYPFPYGMPFFHFHRFLQPGVPTE